QRGNRSEIVEGILEDSLGTKVPERAIFLAGGQGTRLRPLTLHTPKALIDIQGKTLTEHLFDLLKKYGIREAILSIGYLAEKIREHYGDGSKYGMRLAYVEEDPKHPLGTAGPLRKAREHLLHGSFICSNGDELKDINVPEMVKLHKQEKAMVTIALTSVEDPTQYGVAKMDGNKILAFVEKPKLKDAPSRLINSGFYVIEPEVLEMIPAGFSMLERDIFPKLAQMGKLHGYIFSGQWFDTGTVERLENARRNWKGVK
ncbi:nucleotidyltransferase family protein, partial [Candidatus Woesearchaeota archaeon]|nr:nucleotidyltransferase family protein [Candidatus Woesearchaeota archaeon]